MFAHFPHFNYQIIIFVEIVRIALPNWFEMLNSKKGNHSAICLLYTQSFKHSKFYYIHIAVVRADNKVNSLFTTPKI